jgi:hypothetical protein
MPRVESPSAGALQVGSGVVSPSMSTGAMSSSRFAFGKPVAPPGLRQSGSVPTPRPPIMGESAFQ